MVNKHIDNNTLLYLNSVSVSFDGFKAINNLSFVVEKKELRAIIGPNGAGKSTMMDIITGKTRPDEGDVFFRNTIDLTKHDESEVANLGIGRKFQKPSVIDPLPFGKTLNWRFQAVAHRLLHCLNLYQNKVMNVLVKYWFKSG